MRVLLAFPPFADASQPAAALPSLAAALREDGVDVELVDANVAAWEHLLDGVRQRRWLGRVSRELQRLDRRRRLDDAERARYLALADGWLRGSAASAEIAGALRTLRTDGFYDPERYAAAVRAIEGGLALAAAAHHPSRLEWGRFFSVASVESSADVARAVGSAANPFRRFARQWFGPRVRAAGPHVVGISITYLDQVIPAFTLAAECRRAAPEAFVVVGGQIPSQWGSALAGATPLWRWADAFVLGEGETALRGIVEARKRRRGVAGIPNVLTRAGEPIRRREEVEALPCPDYRGLPLDRYLAPAPVLTVSASRGCYWGRCAFCAVSPAFRGAWRERSAERVRGDLRLLWERHGATHFTFGDDALPPRVTADIARGGHGVPVPVRWQAELRWDALRGAGDLHALRRAGATNLVFGFESGSDAVLRRMRKGARLDRAIAVLDASSRAGIGVNLQLFLGFPGETARDLGATLAFLERARGPGVTVSCGLFELQKGSPIWHAPGEFGVALRAPPAGHDLAVRSEYRPRRGRRRCVAAQARIQRRFTLPIPQLRCGINAHALLWLARPQAPEPPALPPSGRAARRPARLRRAIGSAVRTFAWDPESLRCGTPRRSATAYGYSLASGRVVELGPVAAALVRACGGDTTVADLTDPLSPAERRRVVHTLARLARLGLVSDRSPPAAPGAASLQAADEAAGHGIAAD